MLPKVCIVTGLATLSTSMAFTTLPQETRFSKVSQNSQLAMAVTSPENELFFDEEPSTPEKDLPKYSKSIPFLARPKELTLELAGDVGFDPLGLAKNRELLFEYREAEIKHARLAMLAAIGWPFSELYDFQIAKTLNMDSMLDATDRVPSLFNGGMEKVSPVWWGFCLGLTAAIDLYGVSRARSVRNYIPGDLGFDPLELYPPADDVEGRNNMQLAEIKHGRLAMIAVIAFTAQEFVSGIGIVDETPLFFRPIAVLEEVLEEVANSATILEAVFEDVVSSS